MNGDRLCWFCMGRDGPKLPEPDGKPLCQRCKANLDQFRRWLRTPEIRVADAS